LSQARFEASRTRTRIKLVSKRLTRSHQADLYVFFAEVETSR